MNIFHRFVRFVHFNMLLLTGTEMGEGGESGGRGRARGEGGRGEREGEGRGGEGRGKEGCFKSLIEMVRNYGINLQING